MNLEASQLIQHHNGMSSFVESEYNLQSTQDQTDNEGGAASRPNLNSSKFATTPQAQPMIARKRRYLPSIDYFQNNNSCGPQFNSPLPSEFSV